MNALHHHWNNNTLSMKLRWKGRTVAIATFWDFKHMKSCEYLAKNELREYKHIGLIFTSHIWFQINIMMLNITMSISFTFVIDIIVVTIISIYIFFRNISHQFFLKIVLHFIFTWCLEQNNEQLYLSQTFIKRWSSYEGVLKRFSVYDHSFLKSVSDFCLWFWLQHLVGSALQTLACSK